MKVNEAKELAAHWVSNEYESMETFHSAYLAGSVVVKNEKDCLSPNSDLDVLVILNQEETLLKPGKIRYQKVLLDVTYLAWSQFQNLEKVLSSYHLAHSLKTNTILLDPTTELQQVQEEVARHFSEKQWVLARCEDAMQRINSNLESLSQKDQWADQVMAWLFGTGVSCHVLLVAGLKNPTIRLRYVSVRELLSEYQQEAMYDTLLELLGCRDLGAERISIHLDQLEQTFDAAVAVARTPFFFSSDITTDARNVAIDGSRELIASGNRRESVFWIVATFARCHQIFYEDAPELLDEYKEPFQQLLVDLGIHDFSDLKQRASNVQAFLPTLRACASEIMDQNARVTE